MRYIYADNINISLSIGIFVSSLLNYINRCQRILNLLNILSSKSTGYIYSFHIKLMYINHLFQSKLTIHNLPLCI